MPATVPITSALIDESIARSLKHVFDTMLRDTIWLVEKTETYETRHLSLKPQVMGCVGFVGELNGLAYLRFDEDFAQLITGKILGMSPAEVTANGPEVVKDVIGELTNMAVGGFKNFFCDAGYPCKLTLPTIVRGQHLKMPHVKGTIRHLYQFEASGHRLIADVQLKME